MSQQNYPDMKGKELEFISWIHRDGSGTTPVDKEDMSHLDDTEFRMSCLSLTNGTFIASEFSSYVVRKKPSTVIGKLLQKIKQKT